MQISVQAAEGKLGQLIEAARAGEEVIIAEGELPVARIVAVPGKKQFIFGSLKGLVDGDQPDFFEPMGEEELALWEGQS